MLQRGDILLGGRYRIDEPAGEKKACLVFKAKRVSDGTPVALRMLAPFLLRQPHIVARLKSRAEFAMGMEHPNLTRVHEVSEEGGSFVIAESWHEALPLLRVVRGKGACSPYEAAWIAHQLALGVDHLISSGAPGFEFTLSDVHADIGDLRRETEFFSMPVHQWPGLVVRLNPLALDGDGFSERDLALPVDTTRSLVRGVARIVFYLVTGGMGDPLTEPVLSEKFTEVLQGCLAGEADYKTARELLWKLFGEFGPEFTAILSGQETTPAGPLPAYDPATPAAPRIQGLVSAVPVRRKRQPVAALLAGALGVGLLAAAYLTYRHFQASPEKPDDPKIAVAEEMPPPVVEPPPKEERIPPEEPMPKTAGPVVEVKPEVPDVPPVVETEPPAAEEGDVVDYRLRERREAEVRAVYYIRNGNEVEGGTTPLTIRVEDNSSGRARVGLKRERIDGTGVMWDGSVWVAAFVASQSLGQPVTDHEFEVISAGIIDGPSAGMLITATMTALMTKQEVLPNTTMTGTVNPDGTCGPVSGIIEKLEGAAKSGIKRFGYPAGKRLVQDQRGGELLDVEQRAKELGIEEAVEIATLADAYRFLTGKPHPASEQQGNGPRSLPRIDTALLRRLRNSRERIAEETLAADRALLEAARAGFGDGSEGLKKLTAAASARVTLLKEAEAGEQKGVFAVGFYRAVAALTGATIDTMTLGLLEASKREGYAGACAYLRDQSARLGGPGVELGEKVAGYLNNADLSGRIDALNLAAMLQEVEIHRTNGENQLARATAILIDPQGKPRTLSPWEDFLVNSAIEQAMFSIALAKCRLSTAGSWQEISPAAAGVEAKMDPEFFDQQGRSYALAAESSLVLLNAVARDGWKSICRERFEGRSLEDFPSLLWEIEPFYDRAEVAVGLTLRRQMGLGNAGTAGQAPKPAAEEAGSPLVNLLGSGTFAYLEVSKMMLRWYSFPDVEWSTVAESKHSAAFGEFLDAARDNALAKALQAGKICGRVPESVLLNLHLGDELRHGSGADKLSSFVSFWKSSLYSDLLISAYKDSLRKD